MWRSSCAPFYRLSSRPVPPIEGLFRVVRACSVVASKSVEFSCLEGVPAKRILGVSFFDGDVDAAISHCSNGGLVVAPSGPGLANDLLRDPSYAYALLRADLVLPDSGLMTLWWNRRTKDASDELQRISGLLFLKAFIRAESDGALRNSFWIMPDPEQDQDNRKWLAEEAGLTVPDEAVYHAPIYSKSGELADEDLLGRIRVRSPRVIVVNLGGGVQERLGLYLRENLSGSPLILCTGAALAFLSGRQARIPDWADRLYLGWLLRCISAPRSFIPRYWAARKLVGLLRRYGSESPLGAGEGPS